MLLYICTKFHENILDGIKVTERTRFPLEKISKGHNSTRIVGGFTVRVLCKLSVNIFYFFLYPFSLKYL